MAVLPSGDLVISGGALGDLDVGSGPLEDFREYLAVLSPKGELRWIRTAERCTWQRPNVDANGHIIIAVSCGANALGGPPGEEARLVALTAEGTFLWASDDCFDTEVLGVSPHGHILVHGHAKRALTIDGTPDPAAEGDEVLLMLDASGRRQWIRRLSNAVPVRHTCHRGLILEDESVLAVTSPEDHEAMLTKFDPSGHVVWSRALGSQQKIPQGSMLLGTSGVGFDGMSAAGGDILLAGNVGGDGTLGGKPLQGGTQGSMLFARLDAAGNPRWIRVVDMKDRMNLAMGRNVFPASNGEAIGVGEFHGAIDFGGGHAPVERHDGCAILRLDTQGRTRNVEILDDPYEFRSVVSDGKGGLYLSLLKPGRSVASPPGSPAQFRLVDAEYVIRHGQP